MLATTEVHRGVGRGQLEISAIAANARSCSSSEEAVSVRFDNRITRMLGVDIPIANAPMGGVVTRDLVGAVAEAGALGVLPNAMTRDRDHIRAVRDLTTRPLGANIHVGVAEKISPEMYMEEGIRFVTTCIGAVPQEPPADAGSGSQGIPRRHLSRGGTARRRRR
jgi:2-methylisocitrate lyase-like PEP mutase family enzyme